TWPLAISRTLRTSSKSRPGRQTWRVQLKLNHVIFHDRLIDHAKHFCPTSWLRQGTPVFLNTLKVCRHHIREVGFYLLGGVAKGKARAEIRHRPEICGV